MHSIKAIEMFQELNDPPMKTVVGLSNISNGVPKAMRSLIDRTYAVLLMNAGLTAAIANPLDKEMMDTIKTTEVFMNKILYADSYLEM